MKGANKNQSAVALATDSPVNMIETINAKLESFKHITGSSYKTSGKFENIDVQTETDLLNLVKAYSSVDARTRDFNQASDDLHKKGIVSTLPVFKLYGYTPEEWKSDIELRIQIVNQKETIDQLNKLKEEYQAIMEKADVKAMLDKKAAQILKNL